MSSTVATDVGLHAGVRSTGSRRKAASTRWRLVMGATIVISLNTAGSFLLAGGNQQTAPSGRFLFPQNGPDIKRPGEQQSHQGIVGTSAGERKMARTSLDNFDLRQLGHPAHDALDARGLALFR